ncbi:MAG: phage baseplate assembly protein V [Deltaproteobacteria bacterium]
MTTSRVIPKVTVDLDIDGALVDVYVRRALSVPAQLELTYAIAPHAPLPSVTAGPVEVRVEGHAASLFVGEVTATRVELGPGGQRRFVVRAYDRLHRLRRHRPVRLFTETDLFRLAEGLLSAAGCTLATSGRAPVRASIVQHDVDDLTLLVHEAARVGRYLRADGREVELIDLDEHIVQATLRAGDNLLEASVETNVHEVFGEHVAWGASLDDASAHHASARDTTLPEGTQHHVDGLARAEGEVRAMAVAARARSRLGARVLKAVVEGDPELVPGDAVDVEGVGDDETFVMTAVVHRVDHHLGFVTEIDSSPPPTFELDRATTLASGVVCDVEDPEARRRVRVRLTATADVQTPWLPVCLPGGGARKGFVTMPDEEDVVLILAPRGDLANAVVLGGLYGRNEAPSSGTSGGKNHRYAWTTHAGQVVELDADRGVVRVDDGRGTHLEMNEDETLLHSSTDLRIAAPGRRMVLLADAIDFEQG